MKAGFSGIERTEADRELEAGPKDLVGIRSFPQLDLPAVGAVGMKAGDRRQGGEARGVVGSLDADPVRNGSPGFADRAVEEASTLGNDDQAVAETFGVLHDVGAEEDGATAGSEIPDNFLKDLLIDGIEAGEGFVENHEFGVVGDAGEDLDLLAHALGEGFGAGIGEVLEAVTFEEFMGPMAGGGLGQALEGGEVGDDGPGLHLFVEALFLGEIADPMPDLERGGRAEDLDGAGGGPEDVEDHPERGGLAGTIGSEKAIDATVGYGEGEVLNGAKIAVVFGHLIQLKGGGCHGGEGIGGAGRVNVGGRCRWAEPGQ